MTLSDIAAISPRSEPASNENTKNAAPVSTMIGPAGSTEYDALISVPIRPIVKPSPARVAAR